MKCENQVVQTKFIDGKKYFYIHPCGQCLACRINDTRNWYVRSFFEVKKTERPYQYFITLTYDPENYPDDGLCQKRDLKKFLNNLNTSFLLRMRYFATSDYGNVTHRAHYHAIILSTKRLTTSMVERIWNKGFVKIKPLTRERIKYCLRYTVKKTPFDGSLEGWFRLISKGWGNNAVDFYHGQDYFLIDGKKYGLTSYISNKLGLPKRDVDYSEYYDKLYVHYRDILGNDKKSLKDLEKQYFERKKNYEQID